MYKRIQFHVNQINYNDSYLEYEDEKSCPICKAKISPVYVSSSLDSSRSAAVCSYCRNCENSFLTKYAVYRDAGSSFSSNLYKTSQILFSEPNRFVKKDFDPGIASLSPQFDKIYNQAMAAESAGLDEIAGLGYRKAMEFLIKDFAIHEYPEEKKRIQSAPLSQCITAYIDNDKIKTLAQRLSWIGNDEAHYIRKQEDRDISDMKSFIQAAVYFIGMILITEDAASMSPH